MKKPHILFYTLVAGVFLLSACNRVGIAKDTVESEICTTSVSNGWAVNYPKQRKLFTMSGLIWVFYSDGSDAVYSPSAEGLHWSDPVTVRTAGSLGHRFGCWFDGTYIHYAFCAAADGEDVVYRRGTPNKDGTITWSAPEQTVYEVPAGKNVMYPKVIVDSSGRPWVAFMLCDGGFNAAPYDAIVTKSSTHDGTWTTALSFPYVLVDDNTTAYPDPIGVPMTKGKTFWVYNRNVMNDAYYGRSWNGSSWDTEETVTISHSSYGLYNLVADGDDVHMVFGGGIVRYRKRSYLTGWGEEFVLASNASGHTSITRTGPDSVIVTWLDGSKHLVWYREMVEGRWQPSVACIDESADGLANTRLGINSNGLVSSSRSIKSALVYTTGSSAPYKLKFAAIPR